MTSTASPPPPIIASARLLAYAYVDSEVRFTDRITLYVDGTRLGPVTRLAITRNYCEPCDILLEFCDDTWASKGVIAFKSVEEAKRRAERGYEGIASKWLASTYTNDDIDDFLRNEYEVDPNSEWWKTICSFCRRERELGMIGVSATATICADCVQRFYETMQGSDA